MNKKDDKKEVLNEEELLEKDIKNKNNKKDEEVKSSKIVYHKNFNKKFNNLKIKYKKDPKKFAVLISSILLAFSMLIGSSYAYLVYVSKTENTTTINAGTLALDFKNSSNSITISNALPEQDQNGLNSEEEYEFTIENTGSLPATYKITLDNTCQTTKTYTFNEETIIPSKCIPNEYIKVGLSENDKAYKVLEKKLINNEASYIIDTGSLGAGKTKTYKMKLWLDYDTPNTYNAKSSSDYIIYVGQLGLSYEQGGSNLDKSGANELIKTVGTSGLEVVTHSADSTLQIGATEDLTEYRFRGSNDVVTNNYVYFNCSDINNQTEDTCELYRIIGVFPVDDGAGNIENRIKLIKAEDYGANYWDTNEKNNWSTASLKTTLNETYLNSINENYQRLMEDAKYYLGGYNSSKVYTNDMYQYERKTSGSDYYYDDNPNSWTGKIALMYVSDYGYGASSTCANNTMLSEYGSSCASSNWLSFPYDEWLLTPSSLGSNRAFYNIGDVDMTYFNSVGGYSRVAHDTCYSTRPVLYLISDASFNNIGDGSLANPYQLSS